MADVRHRRLFEDAPALQANRLGLAQRQVERMDVAAAVIEQRADVAIAGNFLAYPIRIEQLELGIAVAFPVAFCSISAWNCLFSARRRCRRGGSRSRWRSG